MDEMTRLEEVVNHVIKTIQAGYRNVPVTTDWQDRTEIVISFILDSETVEIGVRYAEE